MNDIEQLYLTYYTKHASDQLGSNVSLRDAIVALLAGGATYAGIKGYNYFKKSSNRRRLKNKIVGLGEDTIDSVKDIVGL